MAIKVGDEVRYLNEVGGGTVVKYQNKNVVLVLQDDGFEVPVLAKECLVIHSASPSSERTSKAEEVPETADETYAYEETPEGDELNLIFAIVPQDPTNIPGNGLDTYLINDSNYFVNYVIAELQDENIFPISNGLIEPNTKLLLQGYSINDLDEIKNFFIQAISFKKDKSFKKQAIVEKTIGVNAVKLSKANSFGTNDYFHEPAIVYRLAEEDLAERLQELTKEKTNEIIKEKERRPRVKMHKKPNPASPIIEIDLHIHELLDNTSGMSNADMLQYQMETFRKALAEYKNKKGKKIVFIHGVGNGTLKTDLRKEVERKYKYPYQDASFREYGYGATMVIIK